MNLNSRICERLGLPLDAEGYYPHVVAARVYGHDGNGFELTGVVTNPNTTRVWAIDGVVTPDVDVFQVVPESPMQRDLCMCKIW